MMGVVIPAHNEEQRLQACLLSVRKSVEHLARRGLQARIVVVPDDCDDGSARIARACRPGAGDRRARCRPSAPRGRAVAARTGRRTDADTRVPAHRLHAQWAFQADVFCGIVRVDDWGNYAPEVVRAFHASAPQDGHPHIHDANMGLARAAYQQVGGFLPGKAHEDVSLVRRCEVAGLHIARRIDPCVVTSARRDARARQDFGDFLLKLERSVFEAPVGAEVSID